MEELYEELLGMQQTDYAVPEDADAYAYAQLLLECFGAPDERVRAAAYSALAAWLARGEFRPKELRGLLLQALSPNGLLFRIGEAGTDSVWKRAYSARIIPAVLALHEQEAFLSAEQLNSTAEQVVEYVYLEQDLYSTARPIAYAADVLQAVARVLPEAAPAILDAVLYAASAEEEVYRYNEGEHLAAVVLTVWQTGRLSRQLWQSWFTECAGLEAAEPARGVVRQNRRLLLGSLHIGTTKEPVLRELVQQSWQQLQG